MEGRGGESREWGRSGKWRVETLALRRPRQRQKQSDIHLLFKTANAIRAFTWKPSTNVTSGNTRGARRRGEVRTGVWIADNSREACPLESRSKYLAQPVRVVLQVPRCLLGVLLLGFSLSG